MKIYKDIEQGTDEWLDIRKWKITGTKLKWVCGWPQAQLTEIYTLLAETYIEEEYLNAYEIIERGNELEPIAKAKYEEITWNKVEEVWFIELDDKVGLSPDWIIANKDWAYTKAIEIKCPRGKNYVKYILENKIPKEYLQQVVNYFIVIQDLEALDFIIYNPDCSTEIKQLHIITVTRLEITKDIDKALDKLESFKQEWDNLKLKLITPC